MVNNYMKKPIQVVILSLIVLISCCITSYTQGQTPDMTMPMATIRGIVLLQDGETPAQDLRVRVWDATTEEIVFKNVTNKDGLFVVPKFENVNNYYYVTVGPVKVDLALLTSRGVTPQQNGVVVILPAKVAMTQTLPPVNVTAAGTATTIGTRVLADDPVKVSP